MWKETKLPGENSCRHGENVQTLHGQWPFWEFIFFPLPTLQQNDVDKTMFFEDLLYTHHVYDVVSEAIEKEMA